VNVRWWSAARLAVFAADGVAAIGLRAGDEDFNRLAEDIKFRSHAVLLMVLECLKLLCRIASSA
jgi:hypothetical protein